MSRRRHYPFTAGIGEIPPTITVTLEGQLDSEAAASYRRIIIQVCHEADLLLHEIRFLTREKADGVLQSSGAPGCVREQMASILDNPAAVGSEIARVASLREEVSKSLHFHQLPEDNVIVYVSELLPAGLDLVGRWLEGGARPVKLLNRKDLQLNPLRSKEGTRFVPIGELLTSGGVFKAA